MPFPWGKFAIAGIGVLGVASVGMWLLIHPKVQDKYSFLGGRSPSEVAVMGPSMGRGPMEYRVYTLQEPWKQVAEDIRRELKKAGIQEVPRKPKSPPGANWNICNSDSGVFVSPGRALRMTQDGNPTDMDPRWVTVFVYGNLDDSWVNIIRYTCFGMPEKP